jgi:hypothetical protein
VTTWSETVQTKTKDDLGWLADAILRHVGKRTTRLYRKGATENPTFNGLNEANTVAILGKVFEGLGFDVVYEHRGYGDDRQEIDLWVEEMAGSPRWAVEVKVIWDGWDNRLNRRRFCEKRELLGDFDRLAGLSIAGLRKVVVWLAFSETERICDAGQTAKTLRLGDAVKAVEGMGAVARLTACRVVDLEQYAQCSSYRYAHALCWDVN